ncbi:MAG: peptidoglycan DD-metalloendopeptidase family protein [Solobacterium sp.]|nr:peptidoglycan DD-metalloendopeptidase family protein [Solobacterium sp.]
MIKRVLVLFGCLLGSFAVVFGLPSALKLVAQPYAYTLAEENSSSVLSQRAERIDSTPHEVFRLYSDGELVGVLSAKGELDSFLQSTYKELYEAEYPGSKLALGTDVYLISEQSYMTYENIDEAIFSYLKENRLFTLRCTGVEFSDENGIYAEIYISDEDLFNEAMNQYMSYFIEPEELALLNRGESTPPLKTYGSRSVGVTVLQTITMQPAYTSPDNIKTTAEEVLDYLEYGENIEREYYTVQTYDTVAGVGSKNHDLSATQVMNINRDQITGTDQILSEGMELCVTYFTSPIDIVVTKESMKKEPIIADTIYQTDNTIREGEIHQVQVAVDGSKNSLYTERWINGVLVSGSLTSSVDTLQPINEIIAVGTMVLPGTGTGSFRWPVDNPYISCHWGCYYGHRAIDIQNAYDRYGNIYAADRGVIEVNSYNGINGNYIIIDHNNGYETYYGHMNVPSPLEEGTVVDKGDIIGQIGMTGLATGPHTHFFIMYEGERRDPCDGFLPC